MRYRNFEGLEIKRSRNLSRFSRVPSNHVRTDSNPHSLGKLWIASKLRFVESPSRRTKYSSTVVFVAADRGHSTLLSVVFFNFAWTSSGRWPLRKVRLRQRCLPFQRTKQAKRQRFIGNSECMLRIVLLGFVARSSSCLLLIARSNFRDDIFRMILRIRMTCAATSFVSRN